LRITYEDIRKCIYRHKTIIPRKHVDVIQSIHLWMETIRSEGGEAIFDDNVGGGDRQHFMAAWITSFQTKGVVDIQFRPEYYKATNHFDVQRLSDYEKRRKAKTAAVDPEFAMTLIDLTGAANGAIFVRSFENRPNVDPYAVNVNADTWL
ncbi:hypothetical protein BG011_001710, partial [Mortierella polycephala]